MGIKNRFYGINIHLKESEKRRKVEIFIIKNKYKVIFIKGAVNLSVSMLFG